MKRKYWTEEELKILREQYPIRPTRELARILGRSSKAIISKAGSLGIFKTKEALSLSHRTQEFFSPPWKHWAPEEEELLKKLYPLKTNRELEQIFHRKAHAIAWKARKLGLRKPKHLISKANREAWKYSVKLTTRRWSEEDDKKLKELYLSGEKIKNIALKMGRSYQAVYYRIQKLGLRRAPITHNLIVGKRGEELAEQLFKKLGWTIIGRPSNSAPYDFVVETGEGKQYIEVKHGKGVRISDRQLRELAKIGGQLLYIDLEGNAFLLPVKPLKRLESYRN